MAWSSTPKAFAWDEPATFACNVHVSSNAAGVPSGTPLGSGSFGRVTGGRSETPQSPAVDGNRFAIGDRANHRPRRVVNAGDRT